MSEIDLEKAKRETLRWLILAALNAARPVGASEQIILMAVRGVINDVTQMFLRREMDYLECRKLIHIGERNGPSWHGELTRDGVDVVEYTVACDPGIARPLKWW
jgi:hypothetical protein